MENLTVFKYRRHNHTLWASGVGSSITSGELSNILKEEVQGDFKIEDSCGGKDCTKEVLTNAILRNEGVFTKVPQDKEFLKRIIKEGGYVKYITRLECL